MTDTARPNCMICGEPMPEGEEMFKMHGYSGDCPKAATVADDKDVATITALRMQVARMRNLLRAIMAEATDNPQRLTAFNSPLMSLASLEHYEGTLEAKDAVTRGRSVGHNADLDADYAELHRQRAIYMEAAKRQRQDLWVEV